MSDFVKPEYINDTYVSGAIRAAVDALILHDLWLLKNTASERSITHKLAQYLEPFFPGYDVDCEYNKQVDGPYKELIYRCQSEDSNRAVLPDIIIHKRGDKDNNLLVIEAKHSMNGAALCDRAKVQEYLIQHDYEYGYTFVFQERRRLKNPTDFLQNEFINPTTTSVPILKTK